MVCRYNLEFAARFLGLISQFFRNHSLNLLPYLDFEI